jgi:hypothetical protein
MFYYNPLMSGFGATPTLASTATIDAYCEGFRMTAHRDDVIGTGAVVRKPPRKEPAGG